MRCFILAGLALCALTARAQSPRQCVNPANVDGLVFLGRSDLKTSVTHAMPAFMGGFRAPAGFSFIGTGVISGRETKVAYKTTLGSDKAYAAALAAMGAEGWKVESPAGSGNIFQMADAPRMETICRNGQRLLLSVAESGGSNFVSIRDAQEPRHRDCNAPQPMMPWSGTGPNAAPRFQFPAGSSPAQGVGAASGGSNDNFTTAARLISTENLDRLVALLGSQIQQQGWQPDSAWSGDRGAGSTWNKAGDGGAIRGTLEIIRVSAGTYVVDFTQTQ